MFGEKTCANDKITVRQARENTVKIFLGTLGWRGVMAAISTKAQIYCMSCLQSAAKYCNAGGRGSTEKFFWSQGIVPFLKYNKEEDYWKKVSDVEEVGLTLSLLDVLPPYFVKVTKESPSFCSSSPNFCPCSAN